MSTVHAHAGPRSIGALLRNPANAINRELLRLLSEEFPEMRQSFQAVFQHIDHPPEGTRLTELAERTLITKQALIETIDEMERVGLVERAADPTDRRAKLIRVTARGMEIHDFAMGIGPDVESRWAKLIGEEEMRSLRRLLEKLNGALAADVHDSAPPHAAQ